LTDAATVLFTPAAGYPVGRQGGAPISESGLVFACVGCCCGHAERGGPKTLPRTLKREMRRAFRDSGVEGRLRLAFTDCLGPCSEANVVFLYLAGRPLWLRRVNDIDAFRTILDWARSALEDDDRRLPPALATRSFTWTGGGEGPPPPIDG
jgi:cobaltochelatase CobN